jgi:hypothetical protein
VSRRYGQLESRPVIHLVLPLVLHGFLALLALVEADETWMVFTTALIPAFALGSIAEKMRYPLWEAVFAASWFPTLMTWTKWYWAIGMPSAGGAGARLLHLVTGIQNEATIGVAVFMAAAGAAGFALMRYDRWWTRKFGYSIFEER